MKRFLIISSLILVILMVAGIALAEENTATTMTLEQALTYAEANSPQIKIAKQNLVAAQGKLEEAKANYLPTLEVGLTGMNLNSGSSPLEEHIISSLASLDSSFATFISHMPGAPDKMFNTTITLKQPLYNANIYIGYETAKKAYLASELDYQQTRENLAFSVTNSYLAICKAKDSIKIAQDIVGVAEKNLHMTQSFFDAGINVKTDVLSTELKVENAKQNLLTMENGYKMAISAFKLTIGYPQDKVLDIVNPDSFKELTLPENPQPPYQNRFDWQKSGLTVEMAELGVKMAQAGYYPTAFASLQYSAKDSSNILPLSGGDTTVMVGLSWSFSLGGKNQAVIKQAEAGKASAIAGQDATQQAAIADVAQTQFAYIEAKNRTQIASLSLKLAQDNNTLAQKRYEAGVGTTLEVSNAQVDLESAEYNELTARYDLYIAELKFQKALGQYFRDKQGDDKK